MSVGKVNLIKINDKIAPVDVKIDYCIWGKGLL